jgi:hypothetical protein
MSVHASFFKESHTALGVFYPVHYIVAVFENLATAKRAERSLREASFHSDDVLVASGQEFIDFENRETGVGGAIMQGLSRFFKTEQLSLDHSLALAEQSAAFLFVHCPNEKSKAKAWDLVHEQQPIMAHYYDRFSVDQLAGEFSTD